MSTPTRGRSDFLTELEECNLRKDLEHYILQSIAADVPLWNFGAYDAPESLDKKAPRLLDLIANADLMKILLKYMPCSKCRDAYLVRAIEDIMSRVKNVNSKSLLDPLFVTGLVRSLHLQLTHLRDMKRYRPRFEYRINQLKPLEQQRLTELMAMINVDIQKIDVQSRIPLMFLEPHAEAVPEESRKSDAVSRIPPMFLDPDDTKPTGTSPPLLGRLPTMFLEDSVPPETPPSKRTRTSAFSSASDSLLSKALSTPPLPATRGGIRAACAEAKAAADLVELVPRIERAYNGRVRSTLRVRVPPETRWASWAEITEKRHSSHFEMISKICEAVRNGCVKSKDEAIRMRDQLLEG